MIAIFNVDYQSMATHENFIDVLGKWIFF